MLICIKQGVFYMLYAMSQRAVFVIASSFLLFSCGAYKQNVMFRTDGSFDKEGLDAAISGAKMNYQIQPDDYLQIEVYTNKGELIVDPNMELRKGLGSQQGNNRKAWNPNYRVQADGNVKLPMIGLVELQGLTLLQADSMLAELYEEYYEEVFVISSVSNRRVVVLGPKGGMVIPLTNENMNLIEVLALYGGLDNNSKAHNIRLIRGDLQNPEVRIVDLSTIKGMKEAQLDIKTNDIVYIEPVRKVVTESVRDITPLISIATSLVTLVIVITR